MTRNRPGSPRPQSALTRAVLPPRPARTPLPGVYLDRPIAHRALHDRAAGRPENSRAAIGAAITGGYGIELDLQPSSDGQAMVFHDADLARLTGTAGMVRHRTAVDLNRLRLLDGDDGIPTFAEVLAMVAGRVPLLVEIKDQDGTLGPAVGPLEQAAADAARDYAGPLAFMSFNPHAVAALGKAAPDVPRGLVTCAFRAEDWPRVPPERLVRLREMDALEATGAGFISHGVADLNRPRVAEVRATGRPVLCWTVRTAAAEAEARLFADNVTFEGYVPQSAA